MEKTSKELLKEYVKSERVTEKAEKGVSKNYRNGYSKKTVKTQLGEVDVKIVRTAKRQKYRQIEIKIF